MSASVISSIYFDFALEQKKLMEKSKGHISFSFDKKRELFEKNGQVFIAPVDNAIMTDGRRVGRWESSISHFMNFAELYRNQFEYLPEIEYK